MKSAKYMVAALCLVVAGSTMAFREDLFQLSKNLDIFTSLYKEVSINYVEDTDPTALMRTGIDAMLDKLDPYTEYVPASEIEDYKLKYVSTQYGGIGAGTLFIDGKLFVNEVSENHPAYKQNIQPGDQIAKVNGVATQGKSRQQISQLLRGPKGSAINLTIIREGKVLNKTLVREEIKQPNVSYAGLLNGDIGYIKLDKFLENAGQEVKAALENINKSSPKGLIIDLRNNGGGILQEAVKIVNLFVDKGQLVVTQKGRNPEKTLLYRTNAQAISPNLPLVVLVNGKSASASEIVAGALQDLDRAIIVGSRSFGKGLVQQQFSLPYNSLVKVTIAKYYTPSGRCIQALDYAHRNKDGQAAKFADSAMKAFDTKGGRIVYNGNGVYPDVPVETPKLSPVAISLISKSLFFDYANTYKKTHCTVAPALSFKITDADYEQFIATLNNKDYSYASKTEQLLADLKKQAEEEEKYTAIKAELNQLNAKIASAKKADLATYKTEIKRLLENQIVGRYYFQKGRIEQSFQYDKDIDKAKWLLNTPLQMLAILKGTGAYKSIGGPVVAGKAD